MQPLPVDNAIPELLAALRAGRNAVLVAPPGSGKTTRAAPAIIRDGMLSAPNEKVLMLQPRRIAARATAARIASEQGWTLGAEVGFQIRFENRTTSATRLTVMTEGILTRRIQRDPFLDGVGCVILDEFHERSIHTDLAIALLREIQTTVREDLRIVVMSATLDAEPVRKFLGDAAVIRAEGRVYPVEIAFATAPSKSPLHERAAKAVVSACAGAASGHVLVFMPGIGEIRRVEQLLPPGMGAIHILHSSVSADAQDRALAPSEQRKIILATNIAETSLTIDGVRTVIDTGFARTLLNDPRLGIDRLELRRISRASADQRAGRAGRTAPGVCHRLWTQAEHGALSDHEQPEILRVDLAGTLLLLRSHGVRDAHDFNWFTAPRRESIDRAVALLKMLGALDDAGNLTPLGSQISALPVHPRLGCLIVEGHRAGALREAAELAALLSERDVYSPQDRRRGAKWTASSDLLDRLDDVSDSANRHAPQFMSVRRLGADLLRAARQSLGASHATGVTTEDELLRIIFRGYPDRLTVRRASDPSKGTMVGGRGVALEPGCVVREWPLFVSLDPRDPAGGGDEARVSIASGVREPWLEEFFPHLLVTEMTHRFDEERGRVLALRVISFAGLVIREEGLSTASNREAASGCLADWVRAHREKFFSGEATQQLLTRTALLRRAVPEESFPDVASDDAIDEACRGQVAAEAVTDAKIAAAVEGSLSWQQRALLRDEAPETIAVPSGSQIRISYQPDGSPILAVRVQELFGLAESPRIAKGRIPVVLHLLGPNYRPVQITADLRSFWNGAYQEVRRELRARYPKHPWPENPWDAPPVSVGRRRR
ncbi:ATP-dependent helicase HrpB [soil metagenome]